MSSVQALENISTATGSPPSSPPTKYTVLVIISHPSTFSLDKFRAYVEPLLPEGPTPNSSASGGPALKHSILYATATNTPLLPVHLNVSLLLDNVFRQAYQRLHPTNPATTSQVFVRAKSSGKIADIIPAFWMYACFMEPWKYQKTYDAVLFVGIPHLRGYKAFVELSFDNEDEFRKWDKALGIDGQFRMLRRQEQKLMTGVISHVVRCTPCRKVAGVGTTWGGRGRSPRTLRRNSRWPSETEQKTGSKTKGKSGVKKPRKSGSGGTGLNHNYVPTYGGFSGATSAGVTSCGGFGGC